MSEYTPDGKKRTDFTTDPEMDSRPLWAMVAQLAVETATAITEFWTGPHKPRPDYSTPLPNEREQTHRAMTDGGTDEIIDGETGNPLDTGLPVGSKGRDVVPDETPPTEAIRIRAGVRPEDHGLKVRECGRPTYWISADPGSHVEVKR